MANFIFDTAKGIASYDGPQVLNRAYGGLAEGGLAEGGLAELVPSPALEWSVTINGKCFEMNGDYGGEIQATVSGNQQTHVVYSIGGSVGAWIDFSMYQSGYATGPGDIPITIDKPLTFNLNPDDFGYGSMLIEDRITGAVLVAADFSPTTLTYTVLNGVPEPSTWAMMLLGFTGLGYAGCRRARRSQAAFGAIQLK